MEAKQQKQPEGSAVTASKDSLAVTAPAITLPKGGGAIRGIGKKFSANPVTGTGSMSVPIFTPLGRFGFGPQLSLSYDSGVGNEPFGVGRSLFLPSITSKTDKGLPRYFDAEDSDVFILSGSEDLVPEFEKDAAGDWIAKDGKPVCNGRSIAGYRASRADEKKERISCHLEFAYAADQPLPRLEHAPHAAGSKSEGRSRSDTGCFPSRWSSIGRGCSVIPRRCLWVSNHKIDFHVPQEHGWRRSIYNEALSSGGRLNKASIAVAAPSISCVESTTRALDFVCGPRTPQITDVEGRDGQ